MDKSEDAEESGLGELSRIMADAQRRSAEDWKKERSRPRYAEEIADEIVSCIGQVDDEFWTNFKQFVAVGDTIDIQTEGGEWFKVKVTKR